MRTIQAAKSKQTDTKPEPGVCSDNIISLCITNTPSSSRGGNEYNGSLAVARENTHKQTSERASKPTNQRKASEHTNQAPQASNKLAHQASKKSETTYPCIVHCVPRLPRPPAGS